jgi:hypothetical protein
MEKLFMSAGVVTAIVLCLVEIIKLPFGKFKEKHPNLYKAIFTIISIILAVGLSVLDEIYILGGVLLSLDFAILVSVVIAGVFGGYCGVYEGLGLKTLVKKIAENLNKAKAMSKDKKVIEFLDKIDDFDIDKAIAFLEEKKHNTQNPSDNSTTEIIEFKSKIQ